MSSNFIEEAKDLSEIMAALRDELLEDFEAAGKRALFEQALQILIAQADAVESRDDLLALAQNIHNLVSQTEELQDLIPDELPDGMQPSMSFPTLDELSRLRVRNMPGIKQHLTALVPDVKSPSNETPGWFDRILDKLGLQRR